MKKWLALAAALVITGCSEKSDTPATADTAAAAPAGPQKVVIYNWTEYIPAEVLDAFTKETGIQVEYATYESNEAMYAKIKLMDGKGYDIAVPSTFYVEKMRKEGLIQPIKKDLLSNYGNLDANMMNKPYDPNNDFSVPYLWGATSIAVNGNDVDASQITKWADLWKPEYAGKLMIMDDVRDNFYVGLRVAGFQNNSTNEEEIKAAYEKLKALWPSIKVINSDSPKTPLIQGNVSIGAIWNGEAYMAQQEMDNLQYIYPEEGAVLWVDSFVIPKGAANLENAHKFIDFMLRAESAKAAIEELGYAAPNTAGIALLDEDLRNNKTVFPAAEDIAKGSFHQDLGDTVLIYEKYWELLKAGQ
ncbi:MAG TPA: extracellular solute-binding protein [Cellvibrio sp.]|uniref:Putrescine-binding periplasmic protein n=1 Tax=Cellvibrio mixtus TaxID=39650 RepID=A0A266QEE8_9GAMM|nr:MULTISPECIES: extracellular solute-binding protein [Cellvibrio]AQT61485.1 spermidine/putrescine ABC transporter substrate-binding protein PotD [Cellvibrio sp. PSBB023]OZY87729.1 spermidine/putrescine ABC transporter substrate-binding protein PotD [Cellvibrio mixtus]